MEEILASIRKIIAEDAPAQPEPEAAPAEDVLELTQLVEEDGSVTDLKPEDEPEERPMAEPEPAFAPTPAPLPEPSYAPPPVEEKTTIVSDMAAGAATASLAALANMVQAEKVATSGTPVGNGMRTLEDMVMEILRPLLKEWMDKNLPAVVERLVQKEIERISHRNAE